MFDINVTDWSELMDVYLAHIYVENKYGERIDVPLPQGDLWDYMEKRGVDTNNVKFCAEYNDRGEPIYDYAPSFDSCCWWGVFRRPPYSGSWDSEVPDIMENVKIPDDLETFNDALLLWLDEPPSQRWDICVFAIVANIDLAEAITLYDSRPWCYDEYPVDNDDDLARYFRAGLLDFGKGLTNEQVVQKFRNKATGYYGYFTIPDEGTFWAHYY